MYIVVTLSVLFYFLKQTIAITGLTGTLEYLTKYGYLDQSHYDNLLDKKRFEMAVEDFQVFAGLEVTGEVDDKTKYVMSLPRCGCKDRIENNNDNKMKRHLSQGKRWNRKFLTYKISKVPENLNRTQIIDEIQKAFGLWAKYTDLTFSLKSWGPADIKISFESGEHGDSEAFEGPGETLAHAVGPSFKGSFIHFDAAEDWTVDSYEGENIFRTAVHEIGHSLGLDHSDVNEAVMSPFSVPFTPFLDLHEDDIKGIQTLYGMRNTNFV